MLKKKEFLVVLFWFIFVSSFSLQAQPNIITLQGVLKDSNGNKINGNFSMTFNFYQTQNDQNPVYSYTPGEKIEVVNGVFNITIDFETQEIFKNYPFLWLGVKVENEPEFPKTKIVSVGYAVHSKYADKLLGAAEDISCSGCIGTEEIKDGAITGIKIKDGEINNTKISSVSWNKLTDIPSDIADGDNDTTYSAGEGLVLNNTVFSLAPSYINGEAYDNRFVNANEANSITSSMIKDGEISFVDLSSNGCQEGEIIKMSSNGWQCATESDPGVWLQNGNIIYYNEGNVGIGSDKPEETGTGYVYNNTKLLRLNDNSNQVRLTISSKVGSAINLIDNGTAENNKWIQLITNDGKTKFHSIKDNGEIKTPDILVIDHNTGNVGIGTGTPNSKLDVNGYIHGKRYLFYAYSDDYVTLSTSNNGNMVISFKEKHDPNNNYNNNTYTAPVSGFYFFQTVISFTKGNGTDDSIDLNFLVNGAPHSKMRIDPEYWTRNGYEATESNVAIFYLNAGDTVKVQISDIQHNNVQVFTRSFLGYYLGK